MGTVEDDGRRESDQVSNWFWIPELVNKYFSTDSPVEEPDYEYEEDEDEEDEEEDYEFEEDEDSEKPEDAD